MSKLKNKQMAKTWMAVAEQRPSSVLRGEDKVPSFHFAPNWLPNLHSINHSASSSFKPVKWEQKQHLRCRNPPLPDTQNHDLLRHRFAAIHETYPLNPQALLQRTTSALTSGLAGRHLLSHPSHQEPPETPSLTSSPGSNSNNQTLGWDLTCKGSERNGRRRGAARTSPLPSSCLLTEDQVVESPINEFNDLLERHCLTKAQRDELKDVRRRKKNCSSAKRHRTKRIQKVEELRDEKLRLTQELQHRQELDRAMRFYESYYNWLIGGTDAAAASAQLSQTQREGFEKQRVVRATSEKQFDISR